MLVTTISGINNVPVGTNLEAIRGRIVKVFEYKSGNNANGDWSLQNITFQDATGTATVALKNREELSPSWAGAAVYFIAGEGKGNRPTGILVDEYKEKRRIMVNASASLEEDQDPASQQQRPQGPQNQQRQQAPRQAQQPRQQGQRPNFVEEERREQQNSRPQNQQRQQPAEKSPEERLSEVKRDILQLSTLFTICHDAAVLHAASVHSRHGHVPHPASIGALATTLFIEANRQQIGRNLPAALPTKVPAPQYRMGDLVKEWEAHQAELASPASVADDSSSASQDLDSMPEKQW